MAKTTKTTAIEPQKDFDFITKAIIRSALLFGDDYERIRSAVDLKDVQEVQLILSNPKVQKAIAQLQTGEFHAKAWAPLHATPPKKISWGDWNTAVLNLAKIRGDIKDPKTINPTQVNVTFGHD